MIEVKQIVRIFKYQQLELADPGRELSPEQVVEFYSGVYPELVKATVEGPELQGTREIYRMERAVGRKGARNRPLDSSQSKNSPAAEKKRHNNVRRRKRSDAHSGF
ncbi:MAG: PRTRC system protein C (plasmid) [Candidatus Manganitrophus sp.]|nr:PRTRC system protein C [Candidatus Manganitrophus sp.]